MTESWFTRVAQGLGSSIHAPDVVRVAGRGLDRMVVFIQTAERIIQFPIHTQPGDTGCITDKGSPIYKWLTDV